MFGSQTFNLQPDTPVAKALSAGYQPISLNLVSGKVYDILLAPSDKLGILAGDSVTRTLSHPVPAAVALGRMSRFYAERDIVGAFSSGPADADGSGNLRVVPRSSARRAASVSPAVEAVRNKATKESFDPEAGVAAYLVRGAQHHGAILRNMARATSSRSAPPLISGGRDRRKNACSLRQGARRHVGDGARKRARVSAAGCPKARIWRPLGGCGVTCRGIFD